MRRFLSLALLSTSLTACTMIPNYHRPALPVSAAYPNSPEASTGAPPIATSAADLGWKNFFADPVSQQLIALSLQNNRDLRVAILNIEEARAQYGVSRASLFPAINGTAGLDRETTPGDVTGQVGQTNIRDYSLGIGAVSWELDLFGNLRSKARAAREAFLSDTETRESTQISLIASVDSEYLTWLADRDSLAIAQNTVAAQQASVQLTQLEASVGTGTAQDVAEAQTTLFQAQASEAQYTRAVAQDMDELVLLVGAPLPDPLLNQMQAVAGLADVPAFPELPAGLPSDLLERRPDIRAAEDTLLSANANIGAARAAFFPSITLTANDGTASNHLGGLFGAGSGAWLFEPNISLPIFAGGENLANLDIAKTEKKIEIANYEKSIQSAFHDVSDALIARTTYATQLDAETNLVGADQHYYDLANMRFKAGVDSYLNVLVARNSLFSAQLSLVSLKLAALQNDVTLYKALGGGWQEGTAAQPAPTATPQAMPATPAAAPATSTPTPLQ
jgi:multidrug efflux system outer membrane protein